MADKDKPTRGEEEHTRGEARREARGGEEVERQIIPDIPAETAMFTTTALIEANFIRQPVPSFLRDRFFSATDFVDSDAVQIDTFRGGKYLPHTCCRWKDKSSVGANRSRVQWSSVHSSRLRV